MRHARGQGGAAHLVAELLRQQRGFAAAGQRRAAGQCGVKVLDRVRDELAPISKVESTPRLEGRQMIMVIAPK